MSLPTKIVDGSGSRGKAKVTEAGQLVVASFGYDLTEFRELAEPDTAYNFYTPLAKNNFVITGFIAKADKQVSATVDAEVIIYESNSPSSTTVSKILFESAMIEGDLITALPLNILVNEGFFINAKTTDDDIYLTITGYYIPIVE